MIANLNWTPAGGINSTGQQVQYKLMNDVDWTTYATVGPTVSTLSIPNLDDNRVYQFRIVNVCSVGGPTTSGTHELIQMICPSVSITNLTHDTVSYSLSAISIPRDIDLVEVKLFNDQNVQVSVVTHNNISQLTGTFSGLQQQTTYQIEVTLKATGQNAIYTKTCPRVNVTTALTPICYPPDNVVATLS
jgi:hypothetical protein